MGSRIREALEISRDYIIDAINIRISTYGEAFRPHQLDEMRKDLSLVESEIALLTAEPEPCLDSEQKQGTYDNPVDSMNPEPCEDARAELDVTVSMICFFVQKIFERPGFCFTKDEREKIKNYVSVYATQVADKRAEELRAQVETLREFVSGAVQWSEAYPENIFTAPTPEQVDAVCNTLGFRIDRISAMVLRDFTGRWSEKARALLAATEPKT